MSFLEWLTSTTTLFGFLNFGIAAVFFYVDPRSPTTRPLVLSFAMVGLLFAIGSTLADRYGEGDIPLWVRPSALMESLAFGALGAWLLRVARTAQTTRRALAGITVFVRLAQAGVLGYFALTLAYPAEHLQYIYIGATEADLQRPSFWVLFTPWLVFTAALVVAGAILFSQPIDPAERVRAIATTMAFPFFLIALFSPWAYAPLLDLVAVLLFLVGNIRYLAMHSEREQFMSRFLSPDVAQMVRTKGLASALQPQTLEITVVSCDIRGFTPYAQCHPSEQVIELLRTYYDAVGEVVADFGGTIKDYAGDGILILVGAPLAVADHAAQGLTLAQRVREAGRGIARKWSDGKSTLGIGVGVASGLVTVGAIGSASRLEYTAVGSAVNLASRLCEQANDGEILVDGRTVELAGTQDLASRGTLLIKGFAEAVPHYALT
jgi:adenylate cyclase